MRLCGLDVFISYRRDDETSFAAGLLRRELPRRIWGLRVFQDVDDLLGGDVLKPELRRRIARSAAVLVLIGPKWAPERLAETEDWVRFEIETALELNKPIYPIRVRDVPMPGPTALPESLRGLSGTNAGPLRDTDIDQDVRRIARSLAAPVAKRRLSCASRALAALAVLAGITYAIVREVTKPPDPMVRIEAGGTVVRPFWIQRTEVTQDQWLEVMGNEPSYFKACGKDCPVERVSWFDALVYLNRRSEREGREHCYRLTCSEAKGKPGGGCGATEPYCQGAFACTDVGFVGFDCEGYRLPTEAEWVRAVGAGEPGPVGHGVDPDDVRYQGQFNAPVLDPIAWYGGNSRAPYIQAHDCSGLPEKQMPGLRDCGPQPVGSKRANRWGLHDGLGNVWEWTHSAGEVEPASQPADRGGSWGSFARQVRIDASTHQDRSYRAFDLGFRPVRTAQE